MSPVLADPALPALPLHLVTREGARAWVTSLPEPAQAWLAATGFDGALGDVRVMPDSRGQIVGAVMGMGDAAGRARGRFHIGRAAAVLPPGVYRIATALPPDEAAEAALGWLIAGYRFDRYRKPGKVPGASLQPPPGVDARRIEVLAAAEALTRDLINTPACDMGPDELEAAAAALAAEFGARHAVTRGGDLLAANLPMIHAVGRASARVPRLIDLAWGGAGPRLTLVGKGVCFDTGGLDIKPAASMGLMKKDMGGAATVLGLARAVMALGWRVRLRVLIPAVENAIAGNAFRPQDILTSRKGLTVEVNNTDAEGRLVLADALALADEEAPDVLVSMATLTGAARVALGPDLAPFYTDDDALAAALEAGARASRDPVWRLPFWPPYEAEIEPGIADLDNAPSGGMAGSITAALFLRRFVGAARRFVHFDIYGWQPKDAPGRPKGGVGQGARALVSALPGVLGLAP
ncbi:MAG: leucyl aminopeptidase family protein [Rhodobacteraceae bacterium]|nr:leucyl aminopeptidase family protein [Paracoccaceae bacterium]